jgi:sigma-B regulation protein RsbU (phosphoserine phosphatase)
MAASYPDPGNARARPDFDALGGCGDWLRRSLPDRQAPHRLLYAMIRIAQRGTPAMLNRLPIKVSGPLLIALPVLALGLLLSVMWNWQSRSAVENLADQNIGQVHRLATTKVADILAVPVRVCEVNAHLVRTGRLDPERLEDWRTTFAQQARSFEMLSSIVWGAGDGRSAWISRYADGGLYWALKDDADADTMNEWRLDATGDLADGAPTSFAFDLFARPWFQTPRDSGKPSWTDPFVWVGGGEGETTTVGISYGIPLYGDEGEFLGIVDADFSLNDLSRFLRSVEVGETGVAALLDRQRRVLAISNDTSIVDADGDLIAAAAVRDPLVAIAAANLDLLATTRETPGIRPSIQHEGEPLLIRTSPVGAEHGLDWTLLTVVPEADFVGDIEAGFRNSTLSSVIAVGLAVGLGLLAVRWLVAPLVTLVGCVRRIGDGDLETEVHLQHAPEYMQLSDAVNEMTAGLRDRLRLRESLHLAMEVQKNLLPARDPDIEGLDIAGHSTYCDETGGDYYDFLDVTDVENDTAVIAIGDVMGHGIAAAMLMATARGVLRSRCAVPGSLGDFLGHLNEQLVVDTRGQRFMTMLLLTVNAQSQELRWASAGHGPPIVFDPQRGDFLPFEGGGLPLGITAGETYEEHVESGVPTGALILAATDGLWETKGRGGELFGMDRLRNLLREHAHRPASDISRAIHDALETYRGPNDQDDDLTFVVARIL